MKKMLITSLILWLLFLIKHEL